MSEGITIWLTGLSGSGKSTIAKELALYFEKHEKKYQLLDGDATRKELGNIFGYTRDERMKVSAINRLLANLLNLHGVNVIMPVMAPYNEVRRLNREKIKNYIEIYVECSLETCKKRDVKGLYKSAYEKKIDDMVGVDDIFEIPERYDLKINTEKKSPQECVSTIVEFLEDKIKFVK